MSERKVHTEVLILFSCGSHAAQDVAFPHLHIRFATEDYSTGPIYLQFFKQLGSCFLSERIFHVQFFDFSCQFTNVPGQFVVSESDQTKNVPKQKPE